jgi:hypothetical protein
LTSTSMPWRSDHGSSESSTGSFTVSDTSGVCPGRTLGCFGCVEVLTSLWGSRSLAPRRHHPVRCSVHLALSIRFHLRADGRRVSTVRPPLSI